MIVGCLLKMVSKIDVVFRTKFFYLFSDRFGTSILFKISCVSNMLTSSNVIEKGQSLQKEIIEKLILCTFDFAKIVMSI